MDDVSSRRRLLGVVAVVPDPGEPPEVGALVARSVVVVQEPERQRREGLCADQFALARVHRRAVGRKDIGGHAKDGALDLAGSDRPAGNGAHEAGAEIGAAGDGHEVHVPLDVLVHVLEARRGEG